MTVSADMSQVTTTDAFLGGRVEAVQPARGYHRSGMEAVLLGASLEPSQRGLAVDLGAGAGVAGFCAASRCPALNVTLVEREPAVIECARLSLARPANAGFAKRVEVAELDIEAPEGERAASGLKRENADRVLMNPPFYDPASVRHSPSQTKARAHVLAGGLDLWFRVAAHALKPGGELIAILPPAMLGGVLAATEGRFGRIRLLPLHPRPGRAAELLMVRAVKGSRAGVSLLSGMVLHGETGNGFTDAFDSVFRGGVGLADLQPEWGVSG